MRMGHQVRAVPGAVLGFDMGAALALGRALGVEIAVAEWFPQIEAVAIPKMNERSSDE